MGDPKLADVVCQKVSDVRLALSDPEFERHRGGGDRLLEEMFAALDAYHETIPEQDCRDVL